MSRRIVLALSVVGLSAAGALDPISGPAAAQSLRDALAMAYQNNPRIAAQRARVRSADELVNQALGNWRPRVAVEGYGGVNRSASRFDGVPKTTSKVHPRGAEIAIDQNLYRGGRTAAEARRRESEVLANRARLSSTEQAVLLDAVTAYMNVARDRAVIALNENNERVLKRQLEATRDRFRVGEVTRTDVAQAESRVSRATADLARARGALVDSRADFVNVIGVPPAALEEVAPLRDLPAGEAEAVEQAKTGDFGLRFADHSERAGRAFVEQLSGELLPQVTLRAAAARNHDAGGREGRTDSVSLTARVRVPLYQSGGVSSRIRAARHEAGRLRNDRDQALRDAVDNAASSWEDYATARAQIGAFGEAVRAAAIALEGVEQEALVGSRTVLDVLDAEQELLDARVSLVRARRDLVVATHALRASVGRLTARSLDLDVAFYDPEENYRAVRLRWYGTAVEE